MDANGFVTWEAEDYDRKLGSFWREENTVAPASGGLAMTIPDNVSDNEYNDRRPTKKRGQIGQRQVAGTQHAQCVRHICYRCRNGIVPPMSTG